MNVLFLICDVQKTRCSMIVNETTLHKRPNDTEILTTIVQRRAFNNEKSPYSIVSYKRPQNDKCKTTKTNSQINVKKNQRKHNNKR